MCIRDRRYLVAVWGLESNFGRFTGVRPTVQALATLAFDGRRGELFRNELFDALRIVERGHIDLPRLKGSWAGAMGQPQFMPSSYLKYAEDFDGDGTRDIWSNQADVFASIANYLKAYGWDGEATWGRQVRLPGTVAELAEELERAGTRLERLRRAPGGGLLGAQRQDRLRLRALVGAGSETGGGLLEPRRRQIALRVPFAVGQAQALLVAASGRDLLDLRGGGAAWLADGQSIGAGRPRPGTHEQPVAAGFRGDPERALEALRVVVRIHLQQRRARWRDDRQREIGPALLQERVHEVSGLQGQLVGVHRAGHELSLQDVGRDELLLLSLIHI